MILVRLKTGFKLLLWLQFMKMKLKSKKIRSIGELIKLDENRIVGVIGRSFLSAGGIPKKVSKP